MLGRKTREYRTTTQFLASGYLLWRIATFKSTLNAAHHSLVYVRLLNSEKPISNLTAEVADLRQLTGEIRRSPAVL